MALVTYQSISDSAVTSLGNVNTQLEALIGALDATSSPGEVLQLQAKMTQMSLIMSGYSGAQKEVGDAFKGVFQKFS